MPKTPRKLATGHLGKVPTRSRVSDYATTHFKERQRHSKRPVLDSQVIPSDAYLRYTIEERIFDEKFDRNVSAVTTISAEEFTLSHLLQNGFNSPLYFANSFPTGMRIPKNLQPQNIVDALGSSYKIEVIDCATQEGVAMNLGDFVRYFTGESQRKPLRNVSTHKIYNLIDLEVSNTPLSEEISLPHLVQEIDFALNVWPKRLFESSEGEITYPKTQKYILMSKAGSYTDFHIDFGGSSVWYHLISGKKLFFIMPPSGRNRNIFAQWVSSGQHEFLGDEVDDCERLELNAGSTLVIPSGWIHAVYTMDDSIVVGGNFLHIFNAEVQLDVSLLERALKVKKSIRYPYFNDLQWLAARHYLEIWRQCSHKVNRFELDGVKALHAFLKTSLETFVPDACPIAEKEILNPAALLTELEVVKPGSTIVFGFSHLHCSRSSVISDHRRKGRSGQKSSSKAKSQGTTTTDLKPSNQNVSTQTDEVECHCRASIRPLFSFDYSSEEKSPLDSIYPAIEQLIVKHKNSSRTLDRDGPI